MQSTQQNLQIFLIKFHFKKGYLECCKGSFLSAPKEALCILLSFHLLFEIEQIIAVQGCKLQTQVNIKNLRLILRFVRGKACAHTKQTDRERELPPRP